MRRRKMVNYNTLFLFLVLCVFILAAWLQLFLVNNEASYDGEHIHKGRTVFDNMNKRVVIEDIVHLTTSNPSCTLWNCIDSYRCTENESGEITVYVYDVMQFVDKMMRPLIPPTSKEYIQLLIALSRSKYAVTNPSKACVFVPSIDLLNARYLDNNEVGRVLASFPYWNNGTNHLLFNMVPSTGERQHTLFSFPYGKAMIAGGSFTHHSYRQSFDVSLPFFNPHQQNSDFRNFESQARKIYLVAVVSQVYKHVHDQLLDISERETEKSILLLSKCANITISKGAFCDAKKNPYKYPSMLTDARFCLIDRHIGTLWLHDMLRAGCVPVIAFHTIIMPFHEILDWKRAAIFVNEDNFSTLMSILKSVDNDRGAYIQLRNQGKFYFDSYLSSISSIALTVMNIINDRILPHRAKSYSVWNRPIIPDMPKNPFFIPLNPTQRQGFTAVVLGYDIGRIELMKQVVSNLLGTKYVSKVLIIWNNQKTAFPSNIQWPATNINIKVFQTRSNRLSNRFDAYDDHGDEIETDCVLSIDDDIVMVPPGELDFAYRVWVENPDRLVGFPPRYHSFNDSSWRYESEWMSNISMVLTGVAFYHKYYHYLFTSSLPANLKTWIDENMNCEDVAMNFLIANYTGKAPIKVYARKKFAHSSSAGLSADFIKHLHDRNTCMKIFTDAFGVMPLRTVEFRADPVLYKIDDVPDSLKWYKSNGAL